MEKIKQRNKCWNVIWLEYNYYMLIEYGLYPILSNHVQIISLIKYRLHVQVHKNTHNNTTKFVWY